MIDEKMKGFGRAAVIYYAKSEGDGHGRVTNQEHISEVSQLAKQFGAEVGMEKEAELSGILHDLGKYSAKFQGVLDGTYHGIDHAFCGAACLYSWVGEKKSIRYFSVMEAIAGHHDGLVSSNELICEIRENMKGNPVTVRSRKEIALSGLEEYNKAINAWMEDFPGYIIPSLPKPEGEVVGSPIFRMLKTRMLFSCLVDADYCVSGGNKEPGAHILDAKRYLESLYVYKESRSRSSDSNVGLNKIRDEIFDRCGEAALKSDSLYTLTAPTGTGKTLALLHFALKHCIGQGRKRIIVVLPFLSLAEQTEKEYRNIFREILIDHSQSRQDETAREISQRWDAPVTITTSVKFFEALFADKPADCRKLHHIANSVVLFDEAQSLPADLASATVTAVRFLCKYYHCSMIFSTATQPVFSALPKTEWDPVEILPDREKYYHALRRVRVTWPKFGVAGLEKTSMTDIARRMAGEDNVCAIVNLRRHARTLYRELNELVKDKDTVFLISSDLCPAHRMEVIEQIQRHLKNGKPCRVVSTQCIEAGVDLDFAVLYRALAPLESIIQAAGRCNRNGKWPGGGRVYVFLPDEEVYPAGGWYEHGACTVKCILSKHPIDLCNLEHIEEYYRLFFQNGKERPALTKALEKFNFKDTSCAYQMIADQGIHVIVPWIGRKGLFEEIYGIWHKTGMTNELIRKAAPITVGSFDVESVRRHGENIPFLGTRYSGGGESDYFILLKGHEKYYDDKIGLSFSADSDGASYGLFVE